MLPSALGCRLSCWFRRFKPILSGMSSHQREIIIMTLEDIESSEPDISTERLIETARQMASTMLGRELNTDDIVDALAEERLGPSQ